MKYNTKNKTIAEVVKETREIIKKRGYHLSKTRQNEMPEVLRNPDGWYEEDCEWCKVVVAFPQFFDPGTLIAAYAIKRMRKSQG